MNYQTVYEAMIKRATYDAWKDDPTDKPTVLDESKRKVGLGTKLYRADKNRKSRYGGTNLSGNKGGIYIKGNFGDKFFGRLKDDIESDLDKIHYNGKKKK